MLCEVQVHLKPILDLDGQLNSHHRYNYFRAALYKQYNSYTNSTAFLKLNVENEIEARLTAYESMLDKLRATSVKYWDESEEDAHDSNEPDGNR
mmetsp:Transcript_119471/g.223339  ORF Transcript_119471/g.223339 Transcript_119471/m.223339 type:complete len:94 (-) Transcript_119471:7-288(-)